MSRLLACAATVVVLMLAGCGARGAPGPAPGDGARGRPPTAGRVTGRLLLEGGPIRPSGRQPGLRPIRGVVTFTTAGRWPVWVRAGRSGIFTVGLPPGRYQLSGRSPVVLTVSNSAAVTNSGQLLSGTAWEAPCSLPLPVTVTAHHTARAAVTCAVP
jgi:hypothetical protein